MTGLIYEPTEAERKERSDNNLPPWKLGELFTDEHGQKWQLSIIALGKRQAWGWVKYEEAA